MFGCVTVFNLIALMLNEEKILQGRSIESCGNFSEGFESICRV